MSSDLLKFREFNQFSRKWCIDRTKEMLSSSFSFFFREHPKYSVPNYDEYLMVIKNPMWFKEVLERLQHNIYTYIHEWVFDMESIWENALMYNPSKTPGYDSALILQKMFRKNCIPVPTSQKNLVAIRRYKILRKLAKTLLNPPGSIKYLTWEIPVITSNSPGVGEDIILEIHQALFKLEPEVKEKLFAHPIIKEIIDNPQKVLNDIQGDDDSVPTNSETPQKQDEEQK